MNQPTPQVTVEILTEFSQKDAAEIGQVLPHLSDRFDGSPVAEDTLQSIILSPSHAQLVARDETGIIIGIATLSLTLGAGSKRNAWMEDFIVAPEAQGKGIGSILWNAALDWCQTKKAKKLNFTSRPSREAAQAFYLKRGARIRETNYFTKAL
jgi:GNAT superfamily N-acetyltransferase